MSLPNNIVMVLGRKIPVPRIRKSVVLEVKSVGLGTLVKSNMEEDFLAQNNPCGQALLQLVSRGNAIIAELLRLKDHIPSIFRLENKQDIVKYGEIIQDFNYFHSPDVVEKKIESAENLREISEEIRDYYGDVLHRFYVAYDSIYKYISDLNTFIEELEDGSYIQQNMDTVFLSEDGVQLMCESVYLYGVMLLVLELYHPSTLRERLIVAYSRYNITVGTLDHVCQLVRSTGFMNTVNAKRPPNYPTEYFKRVPVNETLIDIVIGKLRTEDIYHQQKALPLPQHKTTALAQQSAILFVVLFFSPNTLHIQTARMREIVDKYFSDNWVVNIYMGITVNLIDIWEPFKAAKMALANTLDVSNIKEIANSHGKSLSKLINETNEILTEGNLTKSYIMDNVPKVLSLARQCNVVLRWLLLHTSGRYSVCETVKKSKQVRDSLLVECGNDPQKVLQLLLNTAQFENKVCDLFKTVLNERETQWMNGKAESLIRINELVDVFSGTKHIMRVKKSESLKNWFLLIAEKIDSLKIEETSISARKIAQLIQALEEVQSFQQMTNNLGVKQLATETCGLLRNMLNAVNVRDTLLVQMQIIGDFSYGWLLVDDFTSMIQSGIKENPSLVNKLRAVFLKLSSAMETALLRINQADDGNLPSVSEHYSHQLVLYVRKVLQVIPREVFTLMSEIAHIQTTSIPELPPRLEKEKLRDYAALDARFQIAKLTYEMSVFSTGLLQMQSTLVGIIRVDPRELLEEGVRKELELHITSALETGLTFNPKLKLGFLGSDLQTKLHELGETMEGNKNSFEYIQDYLGINGLKMWQEELKKIIGSKVDQECRMLRIRGATLDMQNSTFMGRLCKQLIQTTDPKVAFYYEMESSWVDIKTRAKLVDLKFFKKLLKAIGVPGLVGLNKILSFLIVKHLQNLVGFFVKEANNNKAWQEMFGAIAKSLTPHTLTLDQPAKVYPQSVAKLQSLLSAGMLETLTAVGQMQLLRKQISFTLNHTARVQARNYTLALSAVNDAYLLEIKKNQKDPSHPCPSAEDLGRLSQLLDWIGLNDPLNQIYVTTRSIPFISLLVFLFTSAQITRFSYEKSYASMICKKSGEGLAPLAIGIHTLLKQFHSKVTRQYITYCCQYTKSYMMSTALLGKQEIPPEALSMMNYLEDFVDYAEVPRTAITEHIPEFILELLKRGIAAYVEA